MPREVPGDTCLLPWRLPGTKVARARSGRWHETWEPLAVMAPACVDVGWRKGEPQAAETVRGRVLMRGSRVTRKVVSACQWLVPC